jgi:hypothetical protein
LRALCCYSMHSKRDISTEHKEVRRWPFPKPWPRCTATRPI